MADYVMLEDIFETTENMTVLRDNRLNDDGTDTVTECPLPFSAYTDRHPFGLS